MSKIYRHKAASQVKFVKCTQTIITLQLIYGNVTTEICPHTVCWTGPTPKSHCLCGDKRTAERPLSVHPVEQSTLPVYS